MVYKDHPEYLGIVYLDNIIDGAERNSEAGFRDEDHYLVYSENLYEEILKSTTDRFINLVEVDVEGNRYSLGDLTITDAGIEIGATNLEYEAVSENATSSSSGSNVRIVNKDKTAINTNCIVDENMEKIIIKFEDERYTTRISQIYINEVPILE